MHDKFCIATQVPENFLMSGFCQFLHILFPVCVKELRLLLVYFLLKHYVLSFAKEAVPRIPCSLTL